MLEAAVSPLPHTSCSIRTNLPINPITPKVDISALKKKLGVESRALKASMIKADLT
jgi:hypothetical protein